jgi:hypothetical protein
MVIFRQSSITLGCLKMILFHNDDSQTVGATVQNLVATATCHARFVRPCKIQNSVLANSWCLLNLVYFYFHRLYDLGLL